MDHLCLEHVESAKHTLLHWKEEAQATVQCSCKEDDIDR